MIYGMNYIWGTVLIRKGAECRIDVLVLSVMMVRLVSGVWWSILTGEDVDAAIAFWVFIDFVYW